MAEKGGSAFNSVEQGPEASDGRTDTPDHGDGGPAEHPSVTALRAQFGADVLRHEVQAGDQHVVFVAAPRNRAALQWLKDEQGYDLLVDVTAVDYGGGRPLQVVYQLWSIAHRRALRVKCELPLDGLSIDSVTPLWNAANWLEREVYDLFGVEFRDHPDLRRILMPQDYAEGHPLRKDFPLRGRFSRAEQTRRALSQDYHHYYTPEEIELGGTPGLVLPESDDSADQAEGEP
jgi:NADH-quinone oxidoreductase subunit C